MVTRLASRLSIDFGFRLPSAMDNRPLDFGEFEKRIDKILYVSATPAEYEQKHQEARAEQIIRPTGLLDPPIEVRPVAGQVDDLYNEIQQEVKKKNKVLVTTLTKRMAEELTDYLRGMDVKVKYLHSILRPLSVRRLFEIFEWVSLMFWLVSTCHVKVWIFQRLLWLPFWMQIRKVSYVRKPR